MEQKYADLNSELATLLGWTELQQGGKSDGMNVPAFYLLGKSPVDGVKEWVPMWSFSEGEAFSLAVKMGLSVQTDHFSQAIVSFAHGIIRESFSNHASKELAFSYAITQAAIKSLKAGEKPVATAHKVYTKPAELKTKLTKWEKSGDHPLVRMENTINEYEYTEAAAQGAGFINQWTIVYPGEYILEMNDIFTAVLPAEKIAEIYGIQYLQ